jgi:ribosomal protein S25
MVDKCELDKFFVENSKRIYEVARANIIKYKRHELTAEVLMNECYLYVYEKINNIDNLEPWVFNYLKMQCQWSDNPLTRQEGRKVIPIVEYLEDDKEEHEKMLEAIEGVYKNSNDICKKIVHEVVTKRKIITTRGVANHFKINIASAFGLIKDLKKDIQDVYSKREL